MTAHLQEAAIVETVLADEDRLYRCLHVVVDAAAAGPLEQREGAIVGIEHHLLRLARVGPHEQHPAVAEPKMGDLHDHRHPAQQDDFVAPVELLGLARSKAQRHIGGNRRPSSGVPAHSIVATVVAAPTQLFEEIPKIQNSTGARKHPPTKTANAATTANELAIGLGRPTCRAAGEGDAEAAGVSIIRAAPHFVVLGCLPPRGTAFYAINHPLAHVRGVCPRHRPASQSRINNERLTYLMANGNPPDSIRPKLALDDPDNDPAVQEIRRPFRERIELEADRATGDTANHPREVLKIFAEDSRSN
jgi:hypothetical protein